MSLGLDSALRADDLVGLALDELPHSSVMAFDTELRYVLCRGGGLRDHGFDAGQLEGRLAAEVLTAARWSFHRPMYEAALRGDRTSTDVGSPDGSRQYGIRVGPLTDGQGRIVGGVALATDITDQLRTVAALAASEERFRVAMHTAAVGTAIADPDGAYVEVNDAMCLMLGVPREHLVGRTFVEVSHPEDRAASVAGFQDLKEGRADRFRIRKRYLAAGQEVTWAVVEVAAIRDGTGGFLGTISQIVDVTVEVREREALAGLIADNTFDVVLRIRDGHILWVSSSLTRELGWAPEDWIGHHIDEFLFPADQPSMPLEQAAAYANETALSRVQLRDQDGRYRHVETHSREVRTDTGEPDGLVTTFRTIDTEVRAEAELDRRAKLDDLTGALKRDEARAGLSAIMGRVRRSPGPYTALAFCDVDDFKAINDAHGHAGGDEWLAAAARRIAGTIRREDFVARMGGDEFLVVLDGVHDLAEATVIATKITTAVSQPLTIDGEPIVATMSVGVTLAVPQETIDAVISRADRAMYQAKRSGRDQVVPVPAPPPHDQSADRR